MQRKLQRAVGRESWDAHAQLGGSLNLNIYECSAFDWSVWLRFLRCVSGPVFAGCDPCSPGCLWKHKPLQSCQSLICPPQQWTEDTAEDPEFRTFSGISSGNFFFRLAQAARLFTAQTLNTWNSFKFKAGAPGLRDYQRRFGLEIEDGEWFL